MRCVELAGWLRVNSDSTQPILKATNSGDATFTGLSGLDGPSYLVDGDAAVALESANVHQGFSPAHCGVTIATQTDLAGLPSSVADVHWKAEFVAVLWWRSRDPMEIAEDGEDALAGIRHDSTLPRWQFLVPVGDQVMHRPSVIWRHHTVANAGSTPPWLGECDWPSHVRTLRSIVTNLEATSLDLFRGGLSHPATEHITWRIPVERTRSSALEAVQPVLSSDILEHAASLLNIIGCSHATSVQTAASASLLALQSDVLATNGPLARACRRVLTAGFSALAQSAMSRTLGVEAAVHVNDLA